MTAATPSERRWATVRIALGLLQMFGAVAAAMLLITTGMNAWSLGAAVTTCGLTTVSVLLFGSRAPGRSRRSMERQ